MDVESGLSGFWWLESGASMTGVASKRHGISRRLFVFALGLGFLPMRPRRFPSGPHVDAQVEDLEILAVPLSELRRKLRAEEHELEDKDNSGYATY